MKIGDSMKNFYKEIDLSKIVEPYQNAFADWPWYEVSKCADTQQPQRCDGGLSVVSIGDMCKTCTNIPSKIAYESEELKSKFTRLQNTYDSLWYIEEVDGEIALAAFAFRATAAQIAMERYSDVPEMYDWMSEKLGENETVWLDEVFANKKVQQKDNLKNFDSMNQQFGESLAAQNVAYRTTNPAMVRAALRDFGSAAVVYDAQNEVPDRRNFITINLEGEE
jgi:hypothetical protein